MHDIHMEIQILNEKVKSTKMFLFEICKFHDQTP